MENAARRTGDEHEGFWFHGFILTQRRRDAEKNLVQIVICDTRFYDVGRFERNAYW
jgi:hypothetical protein